MAFIYLDALSDDLARCRARRPPALHANLNSRELANWFDAAAGIATRPPAPTAITRTIRAIDEDPTQFARVSDAARFAGLSSSRFQHAFRAAAGVPFRRYRLWRRLGVVARLIGQGASLTEAAYEAGFSSSAHLSATYRTMFGIAPSKLITAGTRIECL